MNLKRIADDYCRGCGVILVDDEVDYCTECLEKTPPGFGENLMGEDDDES